MVDRFVIQLKFTFVHFLQFWVFRRHGSLNFVLFPFKDEMSWALHQMLHFVATSADFTAS